MRTFAFAKQDVPVIEGQQMRMDQAAHELTPVLLSLDAGPVRYRRVLERLVSGDAST